MFLGLKTLFIIDRRNGKDDTYQDTLDKAIAACGYAYDLTQDMINKYKNR